MDSSVLKASIEKPANKKDKNDNNLISDTGAAINNVDENEDSPEMIQPIKFVKNVNEDQSSEAKTICEERILDSDALVEPVKFIYNTKNKREGQEAIITEMTRPVIFNIKKNSNLGKQVIVDSASSDQLTNVEMVKPVKFKDKIDFSSTYFKELLDSFTTDSKFTYYKSRLYVCEKNEIKEVCNFDINIIKKVTEFDGVNTSFYYIIDGLLNGTKYLNQVKFYPAQFSSFDWFHKVWGIECMLSANYNSLSYLKEYISIKAFGVPEEYEYNFVGWTRVNQKSIYLLGNGAIGDNALMAKGSSSRVLLRDISLSESDAYLHTLSMLNLGKLTITLPIFALTILSLMNSIFKEAGVEPKFLMWLFGVTGTRKTTISKLFCNFFGSDSEAIPASFKDTIASLEVKAFEYKDCVLIVDDYHPSSNYSEKTTMNRTAQNLIRFYGDRIGKNRMTRDMNKQTTFLPRGMCLVTGEDIIDGHSSSARIMPVEIQSGDIDLSKLSYFQKTRINYTSCLYNFISYLSNNYDLIGKYLKVNFLRRRDLILEEFNHGRLAESVVFLFSGLEVFLDYGVFINAIDELQKIDLVNMAYDAFMEIASKHNTSILNSEPEIMYLVALQELIRSNKIRVYDVHDNSAKRNTFIFQDDDYYYLIPNTMHGLIVQFWKELDKVYPLGSNSTIKALDKDGLILTCMEGSERKRTTRNPKIKTKAGDRTRYLTINKKVMESILASI